MLIHDVVPRRSVPRRPVGHAGTDLTGTSRVRVRHALSAAQGPAIQRRPAGLINDFDFLGRRVGGGISPGLRDRLVDVQAALQTQHGQLVQWANALAGWFGGTLPTLEEWAGVTSIRSWRRQDSCPPDNCSFHQSGSAVDVNYDLQPYIATRTVRGGTTHFGGEAAGAGLGAQRRAAVQVYDDAIQFMRTPLETADVSARRGATWSTGEATAATYQRFQRVSDALQAYFSLAFLPDPRAVLREPIADIEAASEADLLSTIPETERRSETDGVALLQSYMQSQEFLTNHPNWPRTPREQYFRILRDYEHVRIPMVRGRPEARPGDTRNPAKGFLHMPQHLVEALVDVGGLRWGIADFGERASGDVHHFDLGHHDLTADGQP